MEKEKIQVKKILTAPLAITAGILGFVQGTVWSIMSLLSILCYFSEIAIDSNSSDYTQFIYNTFLHSRNTTGSDKIITPDEFFIFMWFYLIFSAIWMVISGVIIWAMFRKKWHYTKFSFVTWSISALAISLVDVVLTALVGADFHNVTGTTDKYCYGIIMAIVARGFILWVVNVVFIVIMIKITCDLVWKEDHNQTFPFINAYESNESPPWPTPDYQAYSNPGFGRSDSFYIPPTNPTNSRELENQEPIYHEPPREFDTGPVAPPVPYYYQSVGNYIISPEQRELPAPTSFAEAIAQKTATIGKSRGKRSPPINVTVPYIPKPDYTPPNSPNPDGLKSVLRTRSNYG